MFIPFDPRIQDVIEFDSSYLPVRAVVTEALLSRGTNLHWSLIGGTFDFKKMFEFSKIQQLPSLYFALKLVVWVQL